MKAKIINKETNEVLVAFGTKYPDDFKEMEVEKAYNGSWYVKGYCPEKSQEIKEQEIRQVRNEYLIETDKFVSIPDFPINFETKDLYIEYRQYLRDYPESSEDWYKQNPKTFEEFKGE